MLFFYIYTIVATSVQSCCLCRPHGLNAACQASLSIANSQHLLRLKSVELVMPSRHLILCRPLLHPPSVFPSIRVISDESRGYIKGCVLSACLFTCRVHHVKYKTEDADDTILKMPESRKSESEKNCLKTQMQKTEIMASGPITSWQIDGGNTGNSDRLSLLGRQSHCRWGLQP